MMGRLRSRLERYFNRLWYDRPQPGLGWRALSGLYSISSASNDAVRRIRPPGPVIVIGNITVGGGGKTPVVAALAEVFRTEGLKPAIISRGYGGRSPSKPMRVQAGDDPRLAGDEPVLLARSASCPVWVCRKRLLAMRAAFDEGADVVISDDGLQHAALPRSLEICVIDEARGFGNGRLLPAGPLRQPLSRLEQVDLILRKRTGGAPREDSDLPGLPFALHPETPYCLRKRQPRVFESGQCFDAVCGIANPESFFATLESLGIEFRRHVFPDHHDFQSADVAHLEGPLVITEKDAVKLERLDALPETLVLPVRARLPEAVIELAIGHVREFGRP